MENPFVKKPSGLPHSSEAESAMLAALIQSEDLIGEAVLKLQPEWFYVPAHQVLYETLVSMDAKGLPMEPVSIQGQLVKHNQLEKIGGISQLMEYYTLTGDAKHFDFWLAEIKEKYLLRSVIAVCDQCSQKAYEMEDDAPQLLDLAEQKILSIGDALAEKEKEKGMREHVLEAVERLEAMHENQGQPQGLTTGLTDLDQMINGMRSGEMIIIAARPSMGKTSLGMNIAEHVSCDLQKGVAVFSLEMTTEDLLDRLMCSRAKVDAQRIRSGKPQKKDFPALMKAATELANSKLFIDDSPSLTILELRAKARRLKQKHDIQLIVVDYLQLMRGSSSRGRDNRQIEITEISAGLKALAKELKIPVLVMAQLNRNPEGRSGGRPRISDLRESGSIEQDADAVCLLMRPERYAEDEDQAEELEGEATLIIAKQRNGPTGDLPLVFIGSQMRFRDQVIETEY